MTRTLAALAIAGLALTACSGSSDSEPPSAKQLAAELGCHDFRLNYDEMFIREGGTCLRVNGVDGIYSFTSSDTQASWLKVAENFGGVFLIGDRWIVSGHNEAALKAAQAKVGGDIK